MKGFNKLKALKEYYNANYYQVGISFSEFLYLYDLWKQNINFDSFDDYVMYIARNNGSLHREDIRIY